MEEKSECKNCRTWEEEMYWKHFNSLHFWQTLPADFHDHLILPEKFASHMKVQLPDKVSLKGPSGALWQIELLKSDELCFVGNDWKDFVKANDLKENALLMFKFCRNSSFEVLIFDQENSCEKEAAYFVKKCRHTKSDHEDQREASSTEIIEDDDEEYGLVACSGGDANTQTPRKCVPYAAAKGRGRRRRTVILPRKSPSLPEVQTRKKPIRNETGKELSPISQGDVITPGNGESSPKNNDQCHKFGKQPSAKNIANQPTQISERGLVITENGENFCAIDHSHKFKDQSEKRLSMSDTSKELCQNLGKELIILENSELSSAKDQGENEPNGSSAVKEATQILGQGVMTPQSNRESSHEMDHSRKSHGKRGRPKKKDFSESSKKVVYISVSDGKRFSKEYTSRRRPVTEQEKQDALRRAMQKETENSFTVVMRPTCVYKRFFLSIPRDWLHKNILGRNQEVVLRVGEKTWFTTFCSYGEKSQGFCTGWKKFAFDNCLEEFDVLVFTPVGQKDEAVVMMDVGIFRVV